MLQSSGLDCGIKRALNNVSFILLRGKDCIDRYASNEMFSADL